MQGFAAKTLENGLRYVAIHYTAQEGKRGDWAEKEIKSKALDRDEWNREMELHEDIWEGEPVFKSYADELHCPKAFRDRSIPTFHDSIFFGGWDCGATLSPAFVLLQVTPNPFYIQALLEVTSSGGDSMENFAPMVNQALQEWDPHYWEIVRHYGDATVTTRSGATGKSAQDVARQHGINISPVSNAWAPRYAAVTWALNRRIDDRAGFMIDGVRCPMLRQGFQGAYKYPVSASGDQRGPGAILKMPVKNGWSHIQDALQQVMVVVRQEISGESTGAQHTSKFRPRGRR